MPENVHKDFHGAMSYGLKYVHENYGEEGVRQYLVNVANTVYAPLSQDLAKNGLRALEQHWRRIFDLEGARYELSYDGDALDLKIDECPAISHMKKHGYEIYDQFCDHCRVVNTEICRNAGYESSTDYDQNAGKCLQRFWRE